MTKADLVAAIRAKHPEYKDVPDETLVNAALQAHPEYQKAMEPDQTAVGMMERAKGSTTPGMRGTPDQAWWDGFLNDIVKPGSPMERSAHPGTQPGEGKMGALSDIASLLLPSEAANVPATGFIGRALTALKSAGKETEGVRGAASFPFRAYQKFESALPSSMEKAIQDFHGVNSEPVDISTPSAAAGEDWMDRALKQPKPQPTGKVVGKAPVLEDVLNSLLKDEMNPEGATLTTLPDDMATAGEGATKQSGKFGKSGNLGQTGGYSSGRPAQTQPEYDDTFFNGDAAATLDGMGVDDMGNRTPPSDEGDAFGGAGSDEAPHPPEDTPLSSEEASEVPGAPDPDDVGVTGGKPHLSAAEVAQRLRDEYGSRDAGAMLYGKNNPNVLSPADRAEAIKRLAPGASRTPNAAAGRIMSKDMGLDDILSQILGEGDR